MNSESAITFKSISISIPENGNVIIGQTHFIKTVEDLYEAIVNTVPGARFGIAFCEASGPCLVRHDGNDDALREMAVNAAQDMACGHSFVIMLQDCYPINLLPTIKRVPEVCSIFCATANPLKVIVAEIDGGRGIVGVIDGDAPKGVEGEEDIKERKDFLRKIGYKL